MGGRRGSSTLIRLLRSLLLSCAMLGVSALASAQASFNAEQSDLWWSPGEWGWGLQIFEQGDILFATLFVYDAGGHQTVFTAVLSQGAGTAWAGDLTQATTGPYFGSAAYATKAQRKYKPGPIDFIQKRRSVHTDASFSVNTAGCCKSPINKDEKVMRRS